MLSYYIVEQNLFGSHLLIHWRTHTLGFCQKRDPIWIKWLGNPNPNHIWLHYRSITSLNTLLGSVPYPITLLKYSLFFFNLLSYTQLFHNAELCPSLTHFWGIPYPITLQSNSQFQYIWATPNPNTLMRYSLSYYLAVQFQFQCIVVLYPILTHCLGITNNNTLLSYTLF